MFVPTDCKVHAGYYDESYMMHISHISSSSHVESNFRAVLSYFNLLPT